jgi:DNA-binding transcriptional ArsR family regulator
MSSARERMMARVFFALGDGTRLGLLRKLMMAGTLSATALAQDAHVSRQAIVKHLQVLEDGGLVAHERRGREVLYTIDTHRIEEARAFLDGISTGWDRAIERLRAIVESPRRGPQRQ